MLENWKGFGTAPACERDVAIKGMLISVDELTNVDIDADAVRIDCFNNDREVDERRRNMVCLNNGMKQN